jgi:hypothetical protein
MSEAQAAHNTLAVSGLDHHNCQHIVCPVGRIAVQNSCVYTSSEGKYTYLELDQQSRGCPLDTIEFIRSNTGNDEHNVARIPRTARTITDMMKRMNADEAMADSRRGAHAEGHRL